MTLPRIQNADNNPWPIFQHPDELQSNELPHITTHIPFHIEFSLGTNENNPHHNPQDTTIVAISLWDENNPDTQTLTQTQYQEIHTWITQHLQPTLTKHNINPNQITTGPERPNTIQNPPEQGTTEIEITLTTTPNPNITVEETLTQIIQPFIDTIDELATNPHSPLPEPLQHDYTTKKKKHAQNP